MCVKFGKVGTRRKESRCSSELGPRTRSTFVDSVGAVLTLVTSLRGDLGQLGCRGGAVGPHMPGGAVDEEVRPGPTVRTTRRLNHNAGSADLVRLSITRAHGVDFELVVCVGCSG